jgi:glycosyltransferase involved in cell wall biosynthesis
MLPFAASVDVHKPLDIDKQHDIVIVGGGRSDRKEITKLLCDRFNVGVYGSKWTLKGKNFYGHVNGEAQLNAINAGKIYISFAGTVAGFTNVKVGLFEASACKLCLVTEDFSEVYKYFEKDKEIITYSNKSELIDKLDLLVNDQEYLDRISGNSYNRFLKDHTWEARWKKVLSQIE